MTLVGPFLAIALILTVTALLHRSLRRRSPLLSAPPPAPPAEAPKPAPLAGAPTASRSSSRSPSPGLVRPTKISDNVADDYGLLATAAVARTHADALLVKEHLRSAGIRSTLATAPDGQIRVLVFGDEVVRARRLVG